MLNEQSTHKNKKILIINILLIVFTLTVYWQVNQFDFINIDDNVYVTENLNVKSGISLDGIRWAFSTTYADFWHPLTWLSLMFDYQLYGLNAGGYHVTNLILHILSTLLLFWLFHRMTGQIWPSAFVAAFFTLHPLHVESVAWISERKDVLSAFFWMLTLCCYVYYTEKPMIKRYLLVLFSFVLALMSKPMVITLPLIMILLDYWPLNRFPSPKANVFWWQLKEKLPLVILSVIFSLITIHVQPELVIKGWPLPLESRIINALGSFVMYLEKTFWPQDLTVCYPFLVQTTIWQVLGTVLLILLISTVIILKYKSLPYLFVGWFWYAIVLLPVMGIIPVGSNAMADRFTYLPSIGISIMLAWSAPLLFKSNNMRNKILFPSVMVILLISSVLSWQQCRYWKDSLTLFSNALRIDRRNYHALINLASYTAEKGDLKEAISYYDQAVQIKPDQADAYNNRGIVYLKIGQFQLAIKDFNKAAILQPNNPDIYTNRANFYLNHGDIESGCKNAKKACELGNCKTLEWASSKELCN